VEEIGIGGMASVHLARMDGPGGFQKWVAIKRIHPNLVEDDQFVDMFLDEARIAAGINHANVAQVFDLGKDEGTYWIAMEYLHGEPLREVMRRCEERRLTISPDVAARICADAAEGLHAAHELRGKNGQLLGLVHRDVTPHNLFITYDGYTKVVDFGIAKVADRLSETRAGTLKGKLAYMSPEQVRGQDDVDRTTDVFALGVVLWELTTGHRLFRMDTDLDTLEKVQACIVPPPSTVSAGYPIELESVVMKALAKKKADRYPTAREFSRALNLYLQRRAVLIGPEEVSAFVRELFADRIGAREAHLAWAADVTSTINVDQLKSMKRSRDAEDPGAKARPDASADLGRPSVPGPPTLGMRPTPGVGSKPAATPPPPPTVPNNPSAPPKPQSSRGAPKAASSSLMDDEEDIPTTVATREHVSELMSGVPGPGGKLPPPPPAAGRPLAVGPSSPQGAPNAAQLPSIRATSMGGVAAAHAPGNQPRLPDPPPPNQPLGGLSQTVAMPPNSNPGFLASQQQAQQNHQSRPNDLPGFGPPPGMAAMTTQSPPSYGAQQPYPPMSMPGAQGQQPHGHLQGQHPNPMGNPSFGHYPNGPQSPRGGPSGTMPPSLPQGQHPSQLGRAPNPPPSQIETALSLPRPDSVAGSPHAPNRSDSLSTIVLVAVAVLTAICVLALGALIYFKRKAPAPGGALDVPSLVAPPSVGAPPDHHG
jgi:serine/threonine-protein kinase